jgi:hypothetical protein
MNAAHSIAPIAIGSGQGFPFGSRYFLSASSRFLQNEVPVAVRVDFIICHLDNNFSHY